MTGQVPVRWNVSCLSPIPKVGRPVGVEDHQPVALMSVVLKTLEMLMPRLIRTQAQQALDLLQSEYQENLGVKDAVLYMLHSAVFFRLYI